MKNLSNALTLGALCFILLLSCGDAKPTSAPTATANQAQGLVSRDNPTDNLSKKEVIERMNNAVKSRDLKDKIAEEIVDNKKQEGMVGIGLAQQSSTDNRVYYETVKDEPATNAQIAIANKICNCLTQKKIFKSVKNAKSSRDIIKKIGKDKDKEVEELQNCYNTNMIPATSSLEHYAEIFAMKSRLHLNKNCLDGTDKFWIAIGSYLQRNAIPSDEQLEAASKKKNGFLKKN